MNENTINNVLCVMDYDTKTEVYEGSVQTKVSVCGKLSYESIIAILIFG